MTYHEHLEGRTRPAHLVAPDATARTLRTYGAPTGRHESEREVPTSPDHCPWELLGKGYERMQPGVRGKRRSAAENLGDVYDRGAKGLRGGFKTNTSSFIQENRAGEGSSGETGVELTGDKGSGFGMGGDGGLGRQRE